MNERLRNRVTRAAVLSGGGIVFLLAVILSLTPPATGYEFSVYRALPVEFWILAISGLVLCQLLIVRYALWDDDAPVSWRYGVVIALSIETLILSLPYFRGYQAYDRADVLTHIGYIRSIHQYGTPPAKDIYPNIHIVTLSLSYATGIEPLQIINTISVVVPVFSVLAWYAFVVRLYDRRRALLTLPFAILFVAGSAYTNPSPYTQISLVVPFVLYLFVRERQTRSIPARVALAVTAVSLVIYHPIITLFVSGILLVYILVELVVSARSGVDRPRASVGKAVTFQLLVGLFLSWYHGFGPVIRRSREAIRGLLGTSGGQSPLGQYSSAVSSTSPKLSDILVIGFIEYGVSAVFLGIGGLYILTKAYDGLTGRFDIDVYEGTFVVSFVAFAGASVCFLVFDLIVGFGRPLLYVNIFGALLAGPLFYWGYRRLDFRRGVTLFLCVTLVAYSTFGVLSLYHSPLKAEPGRHVTDAELEGSQWLLDHRNRFFGTVEYGITLWRFGDTYFGVNKSSRREMVDPESPLPPPSFGYRTNDTLGSSYETNQYMVITTKGREFYPSMYPDYRDQWRFHDRDFEQLQRDPTTSQVYHNGNVNVYRINGTG
ncbi:hypothetical protein [Haloarcula salina]|uniref:Uncharacterized protein n=1 Tax=Haloarcula salina TaxID=1429914 RepID=A0AA41G9P0_9EURY|nr:hypothetical protein [Haloarcula salina]MBV0902722.1 hypothetical protein [Haloarcula salina]